MLPGSFVTQCTAFVHETWVPDRNTCVTWKSLIPEDSTSQSKKEVRLVKEFEIYSLTIYSQKNIFWLSYQQLREKLFQIIYPKRASCFRSSRNLYERYQFFVLIVYGRLIDYFSPLYIENKVSSRMTFAIIFFSVLSFPRHRKTSKPSRESKNKVEFDHHRVKTNTQAFYGWHSYVISEN